MCVLLTSNWYQLLASNWCWCVKNYFNQHFLSTQIFVNIFVCQWSFSIHILDTLLTSCVDVLLYNICNMTSAGCQNQTTGSKKFVVSVILSNSKVLGQEYTVGTLESMRPHVRLSVRYLSCQPWVTIALHPAVQQAIFLSVHLL